MLKFRLNNGNQGIISSSLFLPFIFACICHLTFNTEPITNKTMLPFLCANILFYLSSAISLYSITISRVNPRSMTNLSFQGSFSSILFFASTLQIFSFIPQRLLPAFLSAFPKFTSLFHPFFSAAVWLAILCIFHFVFHKLVSSSPLAFTFGEAVVVSSLITLSAVFSIIFSLLLTQKDISVLYGLPQEFQVSMYFVTVLAYFTMSIVFLSTRPFVLFSINLSALVLAFNSKKHISDLLGDFFTQKRIFFVMFTAVFILCWMFMANYFTKTLVITAKRKYFHFAAIFISAPMILIDPVLAILGLVFGIFLLFFIEWLRKVFPLRFIDEYYKRYLDEKDGGETVVSHIYLPFAVAFPIALDILFFGLPRDFYRQICILSGTTFVGFGDSLASIVGQRYGRIKIFGNSKSLEGTIAGGLGMLAFEVSLFTFFEGLPTTMSDFFFFVPPVILAALAEALCTQFDNLFVPPVLYISHMMFYRK